MKKSIYSIAKVVVVVFTMIILLTSFETQEISAATAKPSKVKGITVVKTTNSSIKFKWKKVKRAFSYKIYRKKNSAKKYKCITTVYGKKTYEDTYLEDGTVYCYKIKAVNINGKTGKYSKVKKIKTKAYKKLYDMDYFDESDSLYSSYNETTFGDAWHDCIGLNIPYYESDTESYVEYFTNQKYEWFSGEIGLTSFSGTHPDYVIKIYGDDKLLYTSIPMNKKTPYQSFNVNISGCKFIKISTTRTTYWGRALIHNGKFYSN